MINNVISNDVSSLKRSITTIEEKIPSSASSSNKLTDKDYVDTLYDGASKALAYADYDTMITAFNSFDDTQYKVGQNVYIKTLNVPDLWVYEVSNTSVPYTYVDDATFVSELTTYGYVQVGYYKLAQLETQNANISNVTANDIDSQSATNGQVLTADGSGGASWQNQSSPSPTLSIQNRDGTSQTARATVVRDIVVPSATTGNYVHNVLLNYNSTYQWITDINFETQIETNDNTPFDTTTLLNWLNSNGYNSNTPSTVYRVASFVIPEPDVGLKRIGNDFIYGIYASGVNITLYYKRNYYQLSI